MKDIKTVIAQLKKEGAEEVKNLVVKNVTVKELDSYTRVSLTLNKEVRQMVEDKGEYVEGKHNVVFASTISLGAILGNNEDIAFAKNLIMTSPEILTMVLSYAEIDILLEEVTKGQKYENPFGNKVKDDEDKRQFDHDTILVHPIAIRLGKKGQKIAQMLESKMLDAMIAGTFGKVAAGSNAKDED